MKAEELRIGNSLQSDGEPCVIQSINTHPDFEWSVIAGATTFYLAALDDLDMGIPLTPEWLIKFGFRDDGICFCKDISYFENEFKELSVTINQGILIRNGQVSRPRINDEMIAIYNVDVHGPLMVHKLQNLYFALTGKELTP